MLSEILWNGRKNLAGLKDFSVVCFGYIKFNNKKYHYDKNCPTDTKTFVFQ